MVPAMFSLYVLVRALDRIFLYRVSKSMADYTTTLMSIYWSPMAQLMCFVVCLVYLAKKRYWEGDRSYDLGWFSPCYARASKQGAVPQGWVAQFSFWDMLNAVVGAPATPWIPLVLQTPLTNTTVPWCAVLSFLVLKTRYKAVHCAGILLILVSCFSGVVVELQGPDPDICQGLHAANQALSMPSLATGYTVSDEMRWQVANATANCVSGLPPYTDANGEVVHVEFRTLVIMYALFLAAIVPGAYGNVYKQQKLKGVDLDIMWSFFWAGMWQVLWGFLMYPITWVSMPTPSGGMSSTSPSTFGQDMADSWTCFMGTNPTPQINTCEEDPAWAWFMMYLLFNIFYNLLFLWIIKHLSGTWGAIGGIVCGNLAGVFSQYEFLAGGSAKALTMEQWLALILSSAALWVYNIEDEVDVEGNSVYNPRDEATNDKKVSADDDCNTTSTNDTEALHAV